MAMNNISIIENLEGCEFLEKLDLTLNFIVDLTSVKNLQNNIHLKELFLMGNPCADFEGYRSFVIKTLPRLRTFDGVCIQRSDRIKAAQVKFSIELQKQNYLRIKANEGTSSEDNESFWDTATKYTPETRIQMYQELMKLREVDRSGITGKSCGTQKVGRKLVADDGRILNVNEAKLPFEMKELENGEIVLEVGVYRYLDTSLIDVDVQANYVKIMIKGKVLQLVLPHEVSIADSVARRSQTTGKLVINMPKARFISLDSGAKGRTGC